AMLSTSLRSSTSILNSLGRSASAGSALPWVAKSMRPVTTQSRFTTPWLGVFLWLMPLLPPFGSSVQLFQPFGSDIQLFQTFGLGNQLFQSFGSAISFSSLCNGSEMDWMYRMRLVDLNAEHVGRVSMADHGA